MNKNLQMVYTYHNNTKHSNQRYARSLGYMDWATQPDPYRTYKGAKETLLPLAFEYNTLPYHTIFKKDEREIAPLCVESISQFFQFSLGLAAVKQAGNQSWALRCNASSGNLQPTEAYIIASNIKEIKNGLHHYAPKNHSLELIAAAKKDLNLPEDSFLVAISSIVWREAWKYGERSWRYTQLDCGHAFRALQVSSYMLGWKVQRINANEEELSNLIGLNQNDRYVKEERESPDMLLLISKEDISETINIQNLRKCFEDTYLPIANQLSASWHNWEILDSIEDATKKEHIQIEKQISTINTLREESYDSKDILLKRRSAQMMNPNDNVISLKSFETIIASVSSTLDENITAVNLVFFIHSVEDLESGLYILIRDAKYKEELKKEFKDEFLWQEIDTKAGKLYLLKKGDFRVTAKAISCSQDIAKDGAFSLGMLADFSNQLNLYGTHRYKELYWECGAIGQQLYLEATSLKLSATGIGCYLDDVFHNVLGLNNLSHQCLYHFTVGRGLVDERLSTLKPYTNR
ncbi:MAG: SagB-type dehydrogenase family enzyme [Arcobacteraceae bacterium]|jgi:SagB-type dehydrogenase family enzyme